MCCVKEAAYFCLCLPYVVNPVCFFFSSPVSGAIVLPRAPDMGVALSFAFLYDHILIFAFVLLLRQQVLPHMLCC